MLLAGRDSINHFAVATFSLIARPSAGDCSKSLNRPLSKLIEVAIWSMLE